GDLLWNSGKHAEATEEYRRVLAFREELDPNDPREQDGLAWTLATCADPLLRNAPRAVRIAKRVVEMMSNSGSYWITLGAAHYEAGEYEAAVLALERARQLSYEYDSSGLFFLAMAHCKLGHKEQARTCLREGIDMLEKKEMHLLESLRRRRE